MRTRIFLTENLTLYLPCSLMDDFNFSAPPTSVASASAPASSQGAFNFLGDVFASSSQPAQAKPQSTEAKPAATFNFDNFMSTSPTKPPQNAAPTPISTPAFDPFGRYDHLHCNQRGLYCVFGQSWRIFQCRPVATHPGTHPHPKFGQATVSGIAVWIFKHHPIPIPRGATTTAAASTSFGAAEGTLQYVSA
jgi:hypothetical protein